MPITCPEHLILKMHEAKSTNGETLLMSILHSPANFLFVVSKCTPQHFGLKHTQFMFFPQRSRPSYEYYRL
jgi:hypothetical protein